MITVRIATSDDISSISKIYIETLQSAYRGIMPDELLDHLSAEQCNDMWQKIFFQGHKMFVAIKDENVVGFSSFGTTHNEVSDPYHTAEIQSLHVSPSNWKNKIGTALCETMLKAIRLDNFSKIIVWVFTKNDRARYFYEKIGFSLTNNIKTHWHSYEIEQVQYEIELH